MFHYDITEEDVRMVATSSNGIDYNLTFIASGSKDTFSLVATDKQVYAMLLILCYESFSDNAVSLKCAVRAAYEVAEEILKRVPDSCRIIS